MNVEIGGAHGHNVENLPRTVSWSSYTVAYICGSSSWMKDFNVYRPKNTSLAYDIAKICKTACDNDHITYHNVYGSPDAPNTPENRKLNHGLWIATGNEYTTQDCCCDCSSLVSWCLTKALGTRIDNGPSGLGTWMKNSDMFTYMGKMTDLSESNPPHTGDIIQSSGHIEMCVSGADSVTGFPVTSGQGSYSVYSSSGFIQSPATLDYSKPIPSDYWNPAPKQGMVKVDSFGGKTINIYTPPGYSASMVCNTFYFKLGQGNFASQMWNYTRSNFNYVIDNIIQRGEASHTIIVSIDGGGDSTWFASNINGLVGYIESRYNTPKTPSARAIGGWSLGAIDLKNYVQSHSGLFNWVDIQAASYQSVDNAFRNMSSSPFVGVVCGSNDGSAVSFTNQCKSLFTEQGSRFYRNVAQVVPGGYHVIDSQWQYFCNALKFFFGGSGMNYTFPSSSYGVFQQQDTFIPRKTEPVPGSEEYEKYYKVAFETPYGVTKNGAYSWGRFSEVLGSDCLLSKGAPRRWFQEESDGYSRGVSPSLGAVMCYTNVLNPMDPGMVCNVEEVGTGSVLVSRMSVKDGKFECVRITKTNGSWDEDIDGDGKNEYMFQGFIYNPTVQRKAYDTGESLLKRFIENARKQVGNTGDYVEKYTSVSSASAWSGAFVVAVAKETGRILNVVIPEETSCSQFPETGVAKNMGFWLDGAPNKGNPYPQIGDVVCIRLTAHEGSTNKYECDKLGIIVEVDSSQSTVDETNRTVGVNFRCVVGDNAGKVSIVAYRTNSTCVGGLYRPDWDAVDGLNGASQYFYNIQAFYAKGAAMEDAVIKDMKHITINDSGIEPSIQETGLTLCAVNYAGIVGSVYSLFAQVYSSNASNPGMMVDLLDTSEESLVNYGFDSSYHTAESAEGLTLDISGINESGSVKIGNETLVLNNVVRDVYGFLNNLFSNPAGAVGFMANIFAESRFNTAALNSVSGAAGICQWTQGRKQQMIACCESHGEGPWQQNLTGQLTYLQVELMGSYASTLNACRTCSKDIQGAKIACEFALRNFEVPGSYEINVPLRNGYTVSIWNLLFGGQ